MNIKLSIIAILVSVVFLLSCSDSSHGPQINPEFNREAKIIQTRVIVHENRSSIDRAYVEFHRNIGMAPPTPQRKDGWSGWNLSAPYQCEIHVLKIQGLNDPQMTTWGHELAHCLYGSYHKDGER